MSAAGPGTVAALERAMRAAMWRAFLYGVVVGLAVAAAVRP